MTKYADLHGAIVAELGLGPKDGKAALMAFWWLDSRAEEVPGRTITEREYNNAVIEADTFAERLNLLGFTVAPAPEPTNAERLEQVIRESGFEVFTSGFAADASELARALDEDGVKAPDHD